MRHITEKSCNAFKNEKEFRLSNSEVTVKEDDTCILTRYYLHGNKIAELYNRKGGKKQLFISNCGYETNVTKERLNGILNAFGLGGIYQKNFKWYIETKNEITTFPSGRNEAFGFTL